MGYLTGAHGFLTGAHGFLELGSQMVVSKGYLHTIINIINIHNKYSYGGCFISTYKVC